MLKPKKPAKKLHDLACSQCGLVNIRESDIESTTAFCPVCQQNTQHYSISAEDAPKRKIRKKKSLYSPGKKKMGF